MRNTYSKRPLSIAYVSLLECSFCLLRVDYLQYMIQTKIAIGKDPVKFLYIQWLKNWTTQTWFHRLVVEKTGGWNWAWLETSRPLKCFQKGRTLVQLTLYQGFAVALSDWCIQCDLFLKVFVRFFFWSAIMCNQQFLMDWSASQKVLQAPKSNAKIYPQSAFTLTHRIGSMGLPNH